MKALTISQPWAEKIASGEKFVENRTWFTSYRGRMAIHAGKGSKYLSKPRLAEFTTGAVVAVATLQLVMSLDEIQALVARNALSAPAECQYRYIDIQNHKYCEGPVCWVLADIVRLQAPIPWVGSQGLWNVSKELQELIENDLQKNNVV